MCLAATTILYPCFLDNSKAVIKPATPALFRRRLVNNIGGLMGDLFEILTQQQQHSFRAFYQNPESFEPFLLGMVKPGIIKTQLGAL